MRHAAFLVFLLGFAGPVSAGAEAGRSGRLAISEPGWQRLEEGLELGVLEAPRKSTHGDSLIRVLRIDPRRFALRLLGVLAGDHETPLGMKDGARSKGLVAAINAGMYQADHRTSVSYMRTRGRLINPRITKDNTFVVFDRRRGQGPMASLVDRQCDDLDAWMENYGTVIQGIRMVSCKGRNVWAQQPKKWSTAALAVDDAGRVLFIHVRSPYSVHDLIDMLMALPLSISRAMYLEGGPEAQLSVRSGEAEADLVGSYETSFFESDLNRESWAVPNVIGVVRRSSD